MHAHFQLHLLNKHTHKRRWLYIATISHIAIAIYISLGETHACDAGLSWELELRILKFTYELRFKITYSHCLMQYLVLKGAAGTHALLGLVRSLSCCLAPTFNIPHCLNSYLLH